MGENPCDSTYCSVHEQDTHTSTKLQSCCHVVAHQSEKEIYFPFDWLRVSQNLNIKKPFQCVAVMLFVRLLPLYFPTSEKHLSIINSVFPTLMIFT